MFKAMENNERPLIILLGIAVVVLGVLLVVFDAPAYGGVVCTLGLGVILVEYVSMLNR